MLKEDPDLELVEPEWYEGFDHGHPEWSDNNQELTKCVRIWPHRMKGEGHFLALLKKKGESSRLKERQTEKAKMPQELFDFLQTVKKPLALDRLEIRQEKVFVHPDCRRDLKGLRIMRSGLLLGECLKNRFEPSQALAMALRADEYPNVLYLSREDDRVIRYLKGETIDLKDEESVEKGWVLICVDNYPLGFGKAAGGSVKNKYLAGQVKDMIKKGRVCVNGVHASKPELKVDPENDSITLDGKKLFYSQYAYYMLNKPSGVITATMDKKKETVLDLLDDKRKDLFPVGRLDIDTEGLLLITNDGELCHRLLSPKHHVDKCYFVKTDLPIPADAVKKFEEGIDLGDFTSMPAKLEIIGDCEAKVIFQEGKFHQVKRMFEAVGVTVVYLKRLSMGSLKLDETLAPGESRALTQEELECLKES